MRCLRDAVTLQLSSGLLLWTQEGTTAGTMCCTGIARFARTPACGLSGSFVMQMSGRPACLQPLQSQQERYMQASAEHVRGGQVQGPTLEIGELCLMSVPHDSCTAPEHQRHSNHATNCTEGSLSDRALSGRQTYQLDYLQQVAMARIIIANICRRGQPHGRSAVIGVIQPYLGQEAFVGEPRKSVEWREV